MPSVDFDFDAVEVKQADQERDAEYYRDKLKQLLRFTCDAVLSGSPSAKAAGHNSYILAFVLKQSPFETQAQLAAHLKISGAAVCKKVKAFKEKNPLLAGL